MLYVSPVKLSTKEGKTFGSKCRLQRLVRKKLIENRVKLIEQIWTTSVGLIETISKPSIRYLWLKDFEINIYVLSNIKRDLVIFSTFLRETRL